jgi:hypothetical protein
VENSNPVRIADNERRFIWPNISESSRDIIISLGTGYSSNYEGEAEQNSALPKALKPLGQMGLVAKLAMLRLVLQNTTNCQKLWRDFRQSLSDDTHLLTKCHRVNVPYGRGQTLCKLDDVSKIDATQAEALAFLHRTSKSLSPSIQEQFSTHLDSIARQLLASLFYFQLLDLYDLNEYKYHCRGLLRCRLGSSCVAQMRSLVNSNPRFRVHDEENPDGNPVALGQKGWNMTDFSVSASFGGFKYAKGGVRIEVSLDNGGHWDDISGFPRKLEKPGIS